MRGVLYIKRGRYHYTLSNAAVTLFVGLIMRYHSSPDFLLKLQGYRLTTAEILYYLPDYPELLQTFIWQNWDLSPEFPQLQVFLRFWQANLEGQLFSVRVAQMEGRARLRFAKEELNCGEPQKLDH